MKQSVRISTFETNSSSMHSITLSKWTEDFTEEEIKHPFWRVDDETGVMDFNDLSEDILEFGRYPFRILNTYFDKLCYYLASKAYTWSDEDYDNYIKQLSKLHPFIKEFKFRPNDYYPEYSQNKFYYGLIDHQSAGLLDQFLKKNNLDVEQFLKSKKYIIIQDGDEYQILNSYKEAGLIYKGKKKPNNTYSKSKNKNYKEWNKAFKDIEDGYSYEDFDDNCLMILEMDLPEYNEKDINYCIWESDKEGLDIGIYEFDTDVPKCYNYPFLKFELLYQYLIADKNRLIELNKLANKYWGVKKVNAEQTRFYEKIIPLAGTLFIQDFLDNSGITLEQLIFSSKYRIINNYDRVFTQLCEAGLIDFSKILNIWSPISYDTQWSKKQMYER